MHKHKLRCRFIIYYCSKYRKFQFNSNLVNVFSHNGWTFKREPMMHLLTQVYIFLPITQSCPIHPWKVNLSFVILTTHLHLWKYIYTSLHTVKTISYLKESIYPFHSQHTHIFKKMFTPHLTYKVKTSSYLKKSTLNTYYKFTYI